jgi:superoxide dismutase, Fe-Mn family
MDSPLQSRGQVLAGITAATIAGTASAATVSSPVAPPTTATPPAFRGQHTPKPLSFDPAKLNGLSEGLLVSHHGNNYAGAVKNLNRLEQELAQVTRDTP